MSTTSKVAAALAGTAIVLAAAVGTASAASAATTPVPVGDGTCAYDGTGMGGWGAGGWGADDSGATGYTAVSDYLADALGLDADAVAEALTAYHLANPETTRGRDADAADLEARHAAEAAYLADALDVDAARVLAALDAYHDTRPMHGGAGMGGFGHRGADVDA